MTFEEAWAAYLEQDDFVIDVRARSWITLARGNETIGRFETFAQALGAFAAAFQVALLKALKYDVEKMSVMEIQERVAALRGA